MTFFFALYFYGGCHKIVCAIKNAKIKLKLLITQMSRVTWKQSLIERGAPSLGLAELGFLDPRDRKK